MTAESRTLSSSLSQLREGSSHPSFHKQLFTHGQVSFLFIYLWSEFAEVRDQVLTRAIWARARQWLAHGAEKLCGFFLIVGPGVVFQVLSSRWLLHLTLGTHQ